jgi:hypothetical protein
MPPRQRLGLAEGSHTPATVPYRGAVIPESLGCRISGSLPASAVWTTEWFMPGPPCRDLEGKEAQA